jgi:hypothetical protein
MGKVNNQSSDELIQQLLLNVDFEALEKLFAKKHWVFFDSIPRMERLQNLTKALAEVCTRDLTLGTSAFAGRLRVVVELNGLVLECLADKKWLRVPYKGHPWS